MPESLTRLLSIRDLARYLGVPANTIYNWRVRGIGPKSLRAGGAIRYRLSDVDAWLESGSEGDEDTA